MNRTRHTLRRPTALLPALLLALLLAWGPAACSLPTLSLQQDPLSPAEHLKLGQAYESSGDLPGALREYQKAQSQEPLAQLYTGNVLFGMGRMEEAEEAYVGAMRALPRNPEPRNNLAWLLYTRRQRLDQAETLAAEALRLAPPGREAEFQDTLDRIREARAQEGR
jgi:tetratricopeptide (TPR) repeat protein